MRSSAGSWETSMWQSRVPSSPNSPYSRTTTGMRGPRSASRRPLGSSKATEPRTMRFVTSPRTATPSSSRTTSCSWTGCRPRAFRASSSDRATISSRKACDAGKGISAHRSSPARLKPYHVETLKAIALLGGTKEYVNLSSGELGKLIGVSQQSASQRILELIREGLVARDLATRRQRIRLTPRGGEILRKEYADYQRIFEIKETVTISGAVASGLHEGAFYMRQKGYKDQFRKKLWFEPYEGTLNLKIAGPDLAKLQSLQESRGLEITGLDAVVRTFGGAKCFLATVGHVDCAVIMPIRTHHTDVLEVISKHYLRGSLGLKDGDIVELIVSL